MESADVEQKRRTVSKQASNPWHPPRVAFDATLEITFVFFVAEGHRRDHFCRSHVHESGVFRRHLGFSWRISR